MRSAFLVLAAVSGVAAASQDLDVLVIVERFTDGEFETSIRVDTTPGLLDEIRLAMPGEPSMAFEREGDAFEFVIDVEPDTTFEQFVTDDATGETFDLQLAAPSGSVTVLRFAIDAVFGPQVDLAALPGFPASVDVVPGPTPSVTWQAPATLGEFLLIFADAPQPMGEPIVLFLDASPLPYTPTPLIPVPQTLDLIDEAVDFPPGSDAGDIEGLVSYAGSIGAFSPQLVSGPSLDVGNALGLVVSSAPIEFTPPDCPADFAAPFGQLTFADIGAFLNAFATSDSTADLAAPFGQLTFADIGAFLAAFNAGCP
jgi:hypothetical protein